MWPWSKPNAMQLILLPIMFTFPSASFGYISTPVKQSHSCIPDFISFTTYSAWVSRYDSRSPSCHLSSKYSARRRGKYRGRRRDSFWAEIGKGK
ncbi:hypothetical protein B0T25DRAFT_557108 [Lasiosphaeria hispida]|uniref:Secreted protein n=1 Tax=Lasiosphaeria hispida TaxID=260671 RepID=A0AAJ0HAL4_9PEZI|nr:hypothetical protein B0T25DRAFT_557108 [Lasiosphaeria hispida]